MAQYVVCGSDIHRLSAVDIDADGIVTAITPVDGEMPSTHYLTREIIVVTAPGYAIPLRRADESLSEYAHRVQEYAVPSGCCPYAASYAVRPIM